MVIFFRTRFTLKGTPKGAVGESTHVTGNHSEITKTADATIKAERAEAFLGFAQAEYEQIKAELLVSIGTQHRSTQYSVVAAAAMFTGVLSKWEDLNVRVAILSLGPLLMGFLWFIWLGEF